MFLDPGEAGAIFGEAAEPQYWREEYNARSLGESKLACPTGHSLLEVYQVKFDSQQVEVDVCPRCRGLWLDRDEGTKLYNIVAGARAHAQNKALGVDRPGLPSYLFQILTGFPIEVWNPVKHRPVVVYSLVAILSVVFVLQLVSAVALGPEAYEALIRTFALVPAAPTPWSFVTYGLLHGGFAHILGNLYFLWVFGDNVEDALGPKRFIILYLIANVAGGLLHMLFNLGAAIPMLGASGAIAGLMGAYLVLFPRVKMWVVFIVFRFRIGVIWYLGFWIGYQLVMGLTGAQEVAWFAHAGGFAAGAGMALMFRNRLRTAVPTAAAA